jgi:hypothetical protein
MRRDYNTMSARIQKLRLKLKETDDNDQKRKLRGQIAALDRDVTALKEEWFGEWMPKAGIPEEE